MTRDQIIAHAFAAIDKMLRPASIARIGGFRPPLTPITSWFGGNFLAYPDDRWPDCGDGPMLPLLQVLVEELPFRPLALDGIALFNVFVGPKRLPTNLPAKNGSRWQIRTYASIEDLEPLAGQPSSRIRPFPVRWELSPSEGPQWEETGWDDSLDEFNRLPDSTDLFYDRYKRHHLTKVGGWPSYIQQPTAASDSYVFQIGSEEKVR